jgi:hypothetical protein
MALSLSGEGPRGPRRGARGWRAHDVVDVPEVPRLHEPAGVEAPAAGTERALRILALKSRAIGERYIGNHRKMPISSPRLASPIKLGLASPVKLGLALSRAPRGTCPGSWPCCSPSAR